MVPPLGMLVLMGSGELTATMVEVHKELLRRLGATPRAVFLDTPAGFQLNVDQISQRAVAYFRERVGHPLGTASLKAAAEVGTYGGEAALSELRRADYVLVGPGSPTYAVRQWAQTPVPEILARRVEEGGCLVAASAAALTMGRFTLPVYEVYKVGEDPHWVEGVDVTGRLGLDLVVVPHWNNAEGGTHDTRFCYMGEVRFRALEAQLPGNVTVLGLDEHTACLLDLGNQQAKVRGIGRVTVRRGGVERTFGKGERFSLAVLRGEVGATVAPREETAPSEAEKDASTQTDGDFWGAVHGVERAFQGALEARDSPGAVNAILDLDRLLWQAQGEHEDAAAVVEAREVLREMIVLLGAEVGSGGGGPGEVLARLVDAFLGLRERWRAEGRWADADAVRDGLQAAGVLVEDTRDGSRWRLAP